MKKIINILCFLLSVLLYSCAGEEVYLIIEDLPETTEVADTTDLGYVYFTASVASRLPADDLEATRFLNNNDTLLLPEGRHVTIYSTLTGPEIYAYYNHYVAARAGYFTATYADQALQTVP